MRLNKEEVLQKALELNGEDRNYEITVEGDKIITRVKWMDATFLSQGVVTDEVRDFEYIVKVYDSGKYEELDKSVERETSVRGGLFNYNKKIFVGKQITFDKTIGVGRNGEEDFGIIDSTFNSEEYKRPVRQLLEECGYKKKMGTLAKIFITGAIIAVLGIAATVAMLIPSAREPISADKFEELAEDSGYMVVYDENIEEQKDVIEKIAIAVDNKDGYQIEFAVMKNSLDAKVSFDAIEENIIQSTEDEEKVSTSSKQVMSYSMYSVTTEETYVYISKVKNTLVYVETDVENKDEVLEFIEKMNY